MKDNNKNGSKAEWKSIAVVIMMLVSIPAGVAFVGTQPITEEQQGTAQAAAGDVIFTASMDNTVKALDSSDGSTIWTFSGHTSDVNSVKSSPTGDVVYTASADGTAKALDSETGELIWSSSKFIAAQSVDPSPHGSRVFVGGANDNVRALDADTGELLWTFSGHTDTVNSVSSSPDGDVVYSGSKDQTVRAIDAETGEQIWSSGAYPDRVLSVDSSPDGNSVYAAGFGGDVLSLDAATGNQNWINTVHTYRIPSVSASPDGSEVYSGSYDDTVKALDTSDGTEIWSSTRRDSVQGVSAGPNGNYVYAGIGGTGNTADKLDRDTGGEIWISGAHSDSVLSVSPKLNSSLPTPMTVKVTNESGDALNQTNVEIYQNNTLEDSGKTDGNGTYSTKLENNTYKLSLSKAGYDMHNETFKIAGDNVTINVTLTDQQLVLNSDEVIVPNSSNPCTAFFSNETGYHNVTKEANFTSENSTILSYNSTSSECETAAGYNTTVNMTIEYNGMSVTREIVVATKTLDNAAIMPASYRVSITANDGVIKWLFISMVIGSLFAKGTRNAFVGLFTIEFMMVLGWFVGYVGLGMVLSGLFYIIFAGIISHEDNSATVEQV